MSKRENFDATELSNALGVGTPPATLTREGRVLLIGEAASALIESGTKAGLFTGGALLRWLEQGGSLEGDYFAVVKPKSHHTASAIWKLHQDEGAKPKKR